MIQTNIASLQGQKNLAKAQGQLATSATIKTINLKPFAPMVV